MSGVDPPCRLERIAALLGATLGTIVGGVATRQRWMSRRRRDIDWAPPNGRQHRGALTARVSGDVGPPLVLIHGLAASGRFWGATFDSLADRARLVVPDLLGFGESPRPASGYGPDGHVDALVACLDELALHEPAVIAAHSLGSLIALHLARRHPDRVQAIVAFAPPLYSNAQEARRRIARTGPLEHAFVLDSVIARTSCRWVCDHRAAAARLAQFVRPDLPAPLAADAVQHTWSSYSETIERVLLNGDARALVRELSTPIKLITGSKDRIVPPTLIVGLDNDRANVEVEIWPDAEHDLILTHPRQCIEALDAALAKSGSRHGVR